MTGFCVGFELTPDDGIYLSLYLGFAEVVFFKEDYNDENE